MKMLVMFLIPACTAGAQKQFVVSPEMKESKIIEKGMAEAVDSIARAQYAQWYKAINPLWQIADSAAYEEAEAWFDNNGDEEKIAGYVKKKREAMKQYEDALEAYLLSHHDEYPAAAIVAHRLFSDFKFTTDEYDKYLSLVADNPDTVHVNFIKRGIHLAKKHSLGIPYIDFDATDREGKNVSLSALIQAHKWTLIDFWASWCGPCRAAIPKIKSILEQHAGKLQIISVSVDEKENQWREAERKEAMPWTQLWLAAGQYDKATDAYSVNAIPRLVLIDSEGKICLVTNNPDFIREKLENE